MADPLAKLDQLLSTPWRRDGHTRWADALPAHTTQTGVREARSTGRLALLVTGRVPPQCAVAPLGWWTGRVRRPWGLGLEL